ncbi:GTP-binding protein Era [Desulfacinum hydrothermale DSM 13146]|uniref:GTPase Era n=1 Tax=Desulfacinum hydrothermale DSM 13146 TaxID=1121390 RepID=A0A1W1X0G5_9BACT|nr:GTPase Era [Desulfacinum hydrothermale]SMC17456.1 GTP-binding protein Era [Desulfacinum hydrothermale DSM 13146]
MKDAIRSGFIALLGAPNVGKSTLMNQVLQEKISITCPKPQTTRNRILGIFNRPDCQMIFVDTPGIHRARDTFNKILVETALSALKEVDVAVFLVDVTARSTDLDRFVLECMESVPTPVVLALNKVDLLKDKKALLPILERYRTMRDFAAVIPLSALTGDGVDDLVAELVKLLPQGPRYYPEDYLTDQPERFFAAEIIREKVFHLTEQEVPYAVAVTIERFREEPERNLVRIEATIHVERDSQKGIVIGKGARMLQEIGRQARQDLERFLGCRVYLGLFVRVQKNWRRDRRVLGEFGYRMPK